MEPTPIHLGCHCSTWHVQSEGVSKLAGKLLLRNGLADGDEIWCVFRDQAVIHIAQVMGGVYLHVRTCRCPPFPYLGNGCTDCAEILYVVSDPLAQRFAEVDVRYVRTCSCTQTQSALLYVRMCAFPYLGNG